MSGFSLYEMTLACQDLEEMLESGVIDEKTYNDTIEGLDIDSKVENICKVIRNLTAKAEAFKAEKDRLAERQKAAENGVKRLKESLLFHMDSLNSPKIEAGLFKVSIGKTEAVRVINQNEIPAAYLIKQPDKVDLVSIKNDIKAGVTVNGCEIECRNYVKIR